MIKKMLIGVMVVVFSCFSAKSMIQTNDSMFIDESFEETKRGVNKSPQQIQEDFFAVVCGIVPKKETITDIERIMDCFGINMRKFEERYEWKKYLDLINFHKTQMCVFSPASFYLDTLNFLLNPSFHFNHNYKDMEEINQILINFLSTVSFEYVDNSDPRYLDSCYNLQQLHLSAFLVGKISEESLNIIDDNINNIFVSARNIIKTSGDNLQHLCDEDGFQKLEGLLKRISRYHLPLFWGKTLPLGNGIFYSYQNILTNTIYYLDAFVSPKEKIEQIIIESKKNKKELKKEKKFFLKEVKEKEEVLEKLKKKFEEMDDLNDIVTQKIISGEYYWNFPQNELDFYRLKEEIINNERRLEEYKNFYEEAKNKLLFLNFCFPQYE